MNKPDFELTRDAVRAIRNAVLENQDDVENLCGTIAAMINGKGILMSMACLVIMIAHLVDAMCETDDEKLAFQMAVSTILCTSNGETNFEVSEENRTLN